MASSHFDIKSELITIGANRHVDSASWNPKHEILAFGGGHLVNLWKPLASEPSNIHVSLKSHQSSVTCVEFLQNGKFLVSADEAGVIKLWKRNDKSDIEDDYQLVQEIKNHHKKTVTTISAAQGRKSTVFLSGSSDALLSFWTIKDEQIALINTIDTGVMKLPLASAITILNFDANENDDDEFVVAIGNTSRHTEIYTGSAEIPFKLSSKLEGQGDWVRALAFSPPQDNGTLILASGCQDRYIRIWKLSKGHEDKVISAVATLSSNEINDNDPTNELSNKNFKVSSPSGKEVYSMKFDALIIGHDDWIYSLKWHPKELSLMSSSADSSVMIWTPDPISGVWLSSIQLGDISIKGASTATGAYGGMWYSSWISSENTTIISLSNTGAWKRWEKESNDNGVDLWVPKDGLSGHVKNVTDVDWSTDGKYLLSTSLDKTTRLFAPWIKNSPYKNSTKWYELSRPQIHGYDMISVKSLNPALFVSAGDEKVLRVFTIPKSIAQLVNNLVGESINTNQISSLSASVPALGLSNKAISTHENGDNDANPESEAPEGVSTALLKEDQSIGTAPTENVGVELDKPPLEDQLQRLTLWPEVEKIYGHGYEVTTLSYSKDKQLVVSTCKANSSYHAVIRITDTETWQREYTPLEFHTLTVTGLAFSPDDKYLLSVSRDRTWALWQRDLSSDIKTCKDLFKLECASKLHSRIVWDCCWLNTSSNYFFLTSSRDKTIKIWTLDTLKENSEEDAEAIRRKNKLEYGNGEQKPLWICIGSVSLPAPVTAIDSTVISSEGSKHLVSAGLDTGDLYLIELEIVNGAVNASTLFKIDDELSPAGRINTVTWNPANTVRESTNNNEKLLAIASEDQSVRVLHINYSN